MADEALGAPLLDRDALVRSLRGESPPEDGKREEDACDARVEPHTPAVDGVDAYFRLSAAASAAKTDLASAAPAFARLLDALSSRVLGRAGQESEIPNFKGSYLGRFPLVSADFWTSDHLLERSRSVDDFSGTRARGTLTLKRR